MKNREKVRETAHVVLPHFLKMGKRTEKDTEEAATKAVAFAEKFEQLFEAAPKPQAPGVRKTGGG